MLVKMRSPIFVAFAALASLLFLAGPAQAHYVYSKGYSYASGTNCTWNRAEVSNGSNNNNQGYVKVDVRSDYRIGYIDVDCAGSLSRPAGYIALKYNLYKWHGSGWSYCTGVNYAYNGSTTAGFARSRTWQLVPCGYGHYYSDTFGYVYNNGWYGGYWNSGSSHYLPSP